ncbi:MAG: glycosyltransferase family 2 protein [Clostridium sp.]|nr:glycosyltransferase family 2 protein [Clostridium sp.]MCM1398475.1 glycosyltransferase family 2 protein [Clostridium sp.]MCM1460197.1 glycosyltransferase family 2 protein [Bacteroides sp.]
MISVIIPAYNEAAMIPKTAKVISGILEQNSIEYELIFVNDGSRDLTWMEIVNAHEQNKNVIGISFSRNFGKEAAMFAGLEKAQGDCAVIIDCDLQHPPEKIVEMYRLWEQGYEVVEAVKDDRGRESHVHGFFANTFYKIIGKATGLDMKNASDFKLMDRKVINVLNTMPERSVFFRALSTWVGFKSTKVAFSVREREEGTSKWSTKALVQYAISNITSFSAAPMQIITVLGCICLLFDLVFAIYTLVAWLTGGKILAYTALILIHTLLSGIIMIGIGVLGYYTSKIYDEVKQRPRYIISSQLYVDDNKNDMENKK